MADEFPLPLTDGFHSILAHCPIFHLKEVQQPAPSSNGPRNYGITMAANRATLMRYAKESRKPKKFPILPPSTSTPLHLSTHHSTQLSKHKTHLELCQPGCLLYRNHCHHASIAGHKCSMALCCYSRFSLRLFVIYLFMFLVSLLLIYISSSVCH